jgi:hypothetical protein
MDVFTPVDRRGRAPRARERAPGLLVFVGIVLLGLASGAALYRWQEPRAAAAVRAELAKAPTTVEGRIDLWLTYCTPMIHHALSDNARFSAELPWLIGYAIARGEGETPELWGIDASALPRDLAVREGRTVVVRLPGVTLLGHGALTGDNARSVPVYPAGTRVADPRARVIELARHFLGRLPESLEDEIEGARFEIRVGS